jgi:competence protein ComEA
MWQSLLLKLGMFATAMGVIFWIGWTVPVSFDRDHNLVAESREEVKVDIPSGGGRVTTVSPFPIPSLADQPATSSVPKRFHQRFIDLNSATGQDFEALPGVGPKLAERILAYRRSIGAFHSLDELQAVKGIGNKTFERIRPLVTVSSDVKLSDRREKTI